MATGSSVPTEFFNLPWSNVLGATITVAVTDDIDNGIAANTQLPQAMIGSEMSLYGNVQGYQTLLKTVFITAKTGPMDLELKWEEGYENISFRSRIMNGGRPLTPPYLSNAALLASQCKINANIYIMPRSGFNQVTNG